MIARTYHSTRSAQLLARSTRAKGRFGTLNNWPERLQSEQVPGIDSAVRRAYPEGVRLKSERRPCAGASGKIGAERRGMRDAGTAGMEAGPWRKITTIS